MEVDEEWQQGVDRAIERGNRIRRDLLTHLHGGFVAGVTPDLLALSREMTAYEEFCERFARTIVG